MIELARDARAGPSRLHPPVAGTHRAGLRTTGRENQGPGSHPAGIDRPVADGSGSAANRETSARIPAGRYEATVRAGFHPDRVHRSSAAILCQHTGVRAVFPAGDAKSVGPNQSPRVPKRSPAPREITWLDQVADFTPPLS